MKIVIDTNVVASAMFFGSRPNSCSNSLFHADLKLMLSEFSLRYTSP